jgi:hypothetical protein
MPKPDEVQAVLDVLFLSKTINWEFEQKMWAESKRKLDYTIKDKLMGRLPSRYYTGWAKNQCDDALKDLVIFALEQAEKARKGKKAIDIYPPTANVVQIQSNHWGVELYLGRAGTHMVDGFDSYNRARHWAIYESKNFLREKHIPEDTKLIIVGDEYW